MKACENRKKDTYGGTFKGQPRELRTYAYLRQIQSVKRGAIQTATGSMEEIVVHQNTTWATLQKIRAKTQLDLRWEDPETNGLWLAFCADGANT